MSDEKATESFLKAYWQDFWNKCYDELFMEMYDHGNGD